MWIKDERVCVRFVFSLVAGFLARFSLDNAASEAGCVSTGLLCAEASLRSLEAVPASLPEKGQLTGFADFREISS